ncbi:MAG: CC0125/CC1285 family lipoprotein [Panacagrimonas sp.]
MKPHSFQSKLVSCTLLIAMVTGCATQTPYQPAAKRGEYGYTETQLTDSRYRITFNGNTLTPEETTKDYALLRAAELTLQKGYDWFQLAERTGDRKMSSTRSDVGGEIEFPAPTEVYQRCGLLHCETVVARSPRFDTGIGVGNTDERASYTSSLEIVMGKKPMPASAESYDARQLAEALHRLMKTQTEQRG